MKRQRMQEKKNDRGRKGVTKGVRVSHKKAHSQLELSDNGEEWFRLSGAGTQNM